VNIGDKLELGLKQSRRKWRRSTWPCGCEAGADNGACLILKSAKEFVGLSDDDNSPGIRRKAKHRSI